MNRAPLAMFFIVTALFVSPDAGRGQSDVAFPPEVYAARRARLVAELGDVPIIVPGRYLVSNGGKDRQDPNFTYLTGVESPFAILVVVPDREGLREVLFLPERFQFAGAQYPFPDPRFRDASWNQPIRRLEPGQNAERVTGIGETAVLDSLVEVLGEILGDHESVFIVREPTSWYLPPGLGAPFSGYRSVLEERLAEQFPMVSFQDATAAVEELRVIKDEYEIRALRRASEISAIGFVELMRRIEPGMNDLEAAAFMEYVWAREGSPRPAFGRIVSSGASAVSLYTLKSENYNSTDRVMQAGEFLYADYGAAEWNMYASDLSRVFPVSGRFSDEQRRLYEIVLEAQEAALAVIRPGVMMADVIRAAAQVFRSHGLEEFENIDAMGVENVWGVMPSPTYWLGDEAHLTDYSGARGTGVRDLGHHIGLEATDGRDYRRPLAPGMVFTVEPKLYVPQSGITIMIEDVILVTEDGYENLSVSAPKSVADIERIMAQR